MPQQATTPLRVLRMLWFALFMSTVIYAVVAYIATVQHPHLPFGVAVRDQRTLILYGMAVASFFAGTVAWNAMRTRPLQLRMVTSMAIFESAAVFGLVATFIANDWRIYLAPWLVTLMGFLRCFPSEETA